MTSVDLTSISTVKFTAKDTKIMMDPTKTWPLVQEQEEVILSQMVKKRVTKYGELNFLKKKMIA